MKTVHKAGGSRFAIGFGEKACTEWRRKLLAALSIPLCVFFWVCVIFSQREGILTQDLSSPKQAEERQGN